MIQHFIKKKKVEERNPKRQSELTELEMNKNSRNSTEIKKISSRE